MSKPTIPSRLKTDATGDVNSLAASKPKKNMNETLILRSVGPSSEKYASGAAEKTSTVLLKKSLKRKRFTAPTMSNKAPLTMKKNPMATKAALGTIDSRGIL